jgi:hypothetical protein
VTTGLVLCRVGAHRLAFHAREIVSITAWSPGDALTGCVRPLLGLPPAPGKALVGAEGEAVVVDTLEIHGDSAGLYPPSKVLDGVAGKSLRGFALIGQALWPIFHLSHFSRFLAPARS